MSKHISQNNDKIPGIVIDSTPKEIEALQKKWTKIKNISGLFTAAFITSVLSPFDIEGPLVEIITGTIASVFLILGKVSEYKLQELKKQYDNSR